MKKQIALLGFVVFGLTFFGCRKMEIPDPPSAPSFCYKASSSQTSYTRLANADSAKYVPAGGWGLYQVDLDFKFDFCGTEFTRIYCMPEDAFATFTYNDLLDVLDLSSFEFHLCTSVGVEGTSETKISYVNEGSPGNQICKIQYDSLYMDALGADARGYLSLQLWLYENDDRIEIHYGDADIGPDDPFNYTTQSGGPTVGLIGKGLSKAAFASGNPANVTPIASNIRSLSRMPESGEVVVFDF